MRYIREKTRRPRGAIAPLAAILLVPLIGMMAFALDVGYMIIVKAELQNAADAAALAGAEKLQALYVQYYLPLQTNQYQIYLKATTNTGASNCPTSAAKLYSSYNQAGSVSVQVQDSDVSFSYSDGISAPQPAVYPALFPNTITVVARRDSVLNGPLSLFFGSVFNVASVNLTATASATIYAGDVSSLQVIPKVQAHILPVALDENAWKTFYTSGLSPDGSIHNGADGVPQLRVYPSPTNQPGNFGLLDVSPTTSDAPAFLSWLTSGQTANDIQYLLTNKLIPVSPSAPQLWQCGPDLTSSFVSNFQSVIGQPYLLPLFVPVNDGSNGQPYQAAQVSGGSSYYQVIGFVGVTVTDLDTGANMTIAIQPMAIVDPTAVILNPEPARPSQTTFFGTAQTTFISAKLTQ
jgi:Flp pilus assembly protein TadG